ncbi:hypothetical protein V2G26_019774 [Clonostachys chloroleuca]
MQSSPFQVSMTIAVSKAKKEKASLAQGCINTEEKSVNLHTDDSLAVRTCCSSKDYLSHPHSLDFLPPSYANPNTSTHQAQGFSDTNQPTFAKAISTLKGKGLEWFRFLVPKARSFQENAVNKKNK